METPVLYFYADKEMDALVQVAFKNGIINQWYPDRSMGQNVNKPFIDLAIPSLGFNTWDIHIMDPAATPKLIDDWSVVTQEYIAPRNTASNCIKTQKDEYEKFIFYRGLANFETPFKLEFNQQNNLIIENKFSNPLSYVLVYDNSPNRQPTIWWSGSMKSGERKVIANPSKDSEFNEVNQEIFHFRDELVNSGLFRDEADALLSTWFEGYFVNITDVEGLRVFWITPETYIDEILPLNIQPLPETTKRVFVGRSEIFKKEFEKELASLNNEQIEKKYKDHRYYNVFKEAKSKGLPSHWSDYNENVITASGNPAQMILDLKLMPNPISESFIVQYRSPDLSDIYFSILDLSGKIIQQWIEKPDNSVFRKNFSLKNIPAGNYILETRQQTKTSSLRFIKS
jgi:hypothetical protein